MNKNHPHLGFLLESRREGISRYYQRDYSNDSAVHQCAFACFRCENMCNIHFKDKKTTYLH